MNALKVYDEGKQSEEEVENVSKPFPIKRLNCAPEIDKLYQNKRYVVHGTTTLDYNPTLEELTAPLFGPPKPGESVVNPQINNTLNGYIEQLEIEPYHFDENYHTYYNFGYSAAPSGSGLVGKMDNIVKYGGRTSTYKGVQSKTKTNQKKKLPSGSSSDVNGYLGPWAPYEEDIEEKRTDVEKGTLSEEQKKYYDEYHKKDDEQKKSRKPTGLLVDECKTQFFGDREVDYQGRSWTLPPLGLKARDNFKSYIPKKCTSTFEGHSKGVQILRLIPKSGHLVLSGSLDNTVRIWDLYTYRKCLRLYDGHIAAVRDIAFNTTGTNFVSASFDLTAKVWDTESGKCTMNINPGSIPYCCVYYPHDDNIILLGCHNHKVQQYDTRTGECVQSYDYHMGTVNQICFYDEGRRFISASDDRQIIAWDYNIPVPIKYITEADISCIPTITPHPNGHTLLGTSLDNKIVAFGCKGNIHLNNRKVYKGHNIAGYACQVGISGDGSLVTSGDSSGALWFWNYKTFKVVRRIPGAHKGPLVGVVWHQFDNKMITCGWDGLVKLWE